MTILKKGTSIKTCYSLEIINLKRNNIWNDSNKYYISILIIDRECPGFSDVGQNIKMNWSTKKDTPLKIEKAVNSWYKEKKDFDEMPNDDRVSNFQFQEYPAIGHYTQLVWADTYKVFKSGRY